LSLQAEVENAEPLALIIPTRIPLPTAGNELKDADIEAAVAVILPVD
jgi:hypothetical protein